LDASHAHQRQGSRAPRADAWPSRGLQRDWIKGQTAAIASGVLSFEAAFLGVILLPTDESVLERIERDDMLKLPPAQ
jgi:hypothetical protein